MAEGDKFLGVVTSKRLRGRSGALTRRQPPLLHCSKVAGAYYSIGVSGTVYYINTGDITISGEVTFDSDQMTLTCISTGGPATTVTWTRDSITVTEGNETVLNDPETAQYTHTLTVTTGGEYTCTVSNNKPSSDSASITVPGIYF